MTRIAPKSLGLALGLITLAACRESTTEPESARLPTSEPSLAAAAAGSWITRAELPNLRERFASTALTNASGQSVVYVMGGVTSDGFIPPTVQAYNVGTNSWSSRAPMPTGLYATNGAGVINGKIYLSGGLRTRRGVAHNALYRYDPATNVWIRKSVLPAPGFGGVTGVINNQLYILTGCGAGVECYPSVASAFYRYTPATDQWTSLPIPTSTHLQGMGGVIGGKFYVVGGNDQLNRLEVYDPATNSWTTKASMPLGQFAAAGRWVGGAVALGGKLYVFGGLQRDINRNVTAVRTANVYNPATNSWTTATPMPSSRAGIVASRVLLNGQPRIEVVGGNQPGTNLQYIP
jgi:N-acetylneuraminic acid mutarotase